MPGAPAPSSQRKGSFAMTTPAYITATIAFLAAMSAYAQPPLQVYDQQGREVGRSLQYGLFVRQYGNEQVALTLSDRALQVNSLFVFTSPDCGQSAHDKAYSYYYWDAVSQPQFARFDGHDIWTADTNFQVIHAQSYSFFWDTNASKVSFRCFPYVWDAVVSNPVHLDTKPEWAPSCTVDNVQGPTWTSPVPICKSVLTVK